MTGLVLDHCFRELLSGEPARRYVEENGCWRQLGEIKAIADALSTALDAAGVPQGAQIGLVARNRMPHIAALFGLLADRRTIVMLHAYQAPERLADEVRSLGLAAIVADQGDWQPPLIATAAEAGLLGLAIGSEHPVTTLTEGTSAPATAPGAGADIAIMMLTSGTTGTPKRVPISYATLTAAVEDATLATVQAGTMDSQAPYIQLYPLGNISGLFGLITCALRGQAIVLLEKFGVKEWVRAVETYRPSAFVSLPPAAIRMVVDAEVPPEALRSIPVMRCGSAPLDPELQRAFEARYGIPILINYGATEFCGVIANWTLEDHRRFGATKRGSVGRARPDISLRSVDPESGEALPTGAVGQLEVLAPRIAGDWVRTTDLAVIDEDGFIFLKGRADSVIIRGGFKISPEAVAQVLRGHAAIGDAGVIGVADARLGEVPVAVIELKAGATAPDERDLIARVRSALSPQAAPSRILFVDRLPRTGSMKVDRAALGRLVSQRLAP